MKRYLLILASAILLIPFEGCKKKSFDPSTKTREDFVGTWQGTISTFKNNQVMKESCMVVIFPNEESAFLSGILFMRETSVFHEFQFHNGTLYFKVDNSDPTNPLCQNWSMGGYLLFLSENEIDIRVNGNECGPTGSEFVNWVGTIVKKEVSMDSVKYFNFANNGNTWTYRVFLDTGDSCQIQKQVTQVPEPHVFSGTVSQNCGWSGQEKTFRWNVTPDVFTIVNDSTLSHRGLSFLINSKPGVVYSSYSNNDTTTVTLLDTALQVITAAGTFPCTKFRYTEPVYYGTLKYTRTSYLWLNNRVGVVRQEVGNPANSTDIKLQVLISKNF